VEILLRDRPLGDRWPDNFYRSYVKLFLGIFYRACRDLNELRHMVSMKLLETLSSDLVVGDFVTACELCIFFFFIHRAQRTGMRKAMI